MLQKDPSRRLSVARVLSHPWTNAGRGRRPKQHQQPPSSPVGPSVSSSLDPSSSASEDITDAERFARIAVQTAKKAASAAKRAAAEARAAEATALHALAAAGDAAAGRTAEDVDGTNTRAAGENSKPSMSHRGGVFARGSAGRSKPKSPYPRSVKLKPEVMGPGRFRASGDEDSSGRSSAMRGVSRDGDKAALAWSSPSTASSLQEDERARFSSVPRPRPFNMRTPPSEVYFDGDVVVFVNSPKDIGEATAGRSVANAGSSLSKKENMRPRYHSNGGKEERTAINGVRQGTTKASPRDNPTNRKAILERRKMLLRSQSTASARDKTAKTPYIAELTQRVVSPTNNREASASDRHPATFSGGDKFSLRDRAHKASSTFVQPLTMTETSSREGIIGQGMNSARPMLARSTSMSSISTGIEKLSMMRATRPDPLLLPPDDGLERPGKLVPVPLSIAATLAFSALLEGGHMSARSEFPEEEQQWSTIVAKALGRGEQSSTSSPSVARLSLSQNLPPMNESKEISEVKTSAKESVEESRLAALSVGRPRESEPTTCIPDVDCSGQQAPAEISLAPSSQETDLGPLAAKSVELSEMALLKPSPEQSPSPLGKALLEPSRETRLGPVAGRSSEHLAKAYFEWMKRARLENKAEEPVDPLETTPVEDPSLGPASLDPAEVDAWKETSEAPSTSKPTVMQAAVKPLAVAMASSELSEETSPEPSGIITPKPMSGVSNKAVTCEGIPAEPPVGPLAGISIEASKEPPAESPSNIAVEPVVEIPIVEPMALVGVPTETAAEASSRTLAETSEEPLTEISVDPRSDPTLEPATESSIKPVLAALDLLEEQAALSIAVSTELPKEPPLQPTSEMILKPTEEALAELAALENLPTETPTELSEDSSVEQSHEKLLDRTSDFASEPVTERAMKLMGLANFQTKTPIKLSARPSVEASVEPPWGGSGEMSIEPPSNIKLEPETVIEPLALVEMPTATLAVKPPMGTSIAQSNATPFEQPPTGISLELEGENSSEQVKKPSIKQLVELFAGQPEKPATESWPKRPEVALSEPLEKFPHARPSVAKSIESLEELLTIESLVQVPPEPTTGTCWKWPAQRPYGFSTESSPEPSSTETLLQSLEEPSPESPAEAPLNAAVDTFSERSSMKSKEPAEKLLRETSPKRSSPGPCKGSTPKFSKDATSLQPAAGASCNPSVAKKSVTTRARKKACFTQLEATSFDPFVKKSVQKTSAGKPLFSFGEKSSPRASAKSSARARTVSSLAATVFPPLTSLPPSEEVFALRSMAATAGKVVDEPERVVPVPPLPSSHVTVDAQAEPSEVAVVEQSQVAAHDASTSAVVGVATGDAGGDATSATVKTNASTAARPQPTLPPNPVRRPTEGFKITPPRNPALLPKEGASSAKPDTAASRIQGGPFLFSQPSPLRNHPSPPKQHAQLQQGPSVSTKASVSPVVKLPSMPAHSTGDKMTRLQFFQQRALASSSLGIRSALASHSVEESEAGEGGHPPTTAAFSTSTTAMTAAPSEQDRGDEVVLEAETSGTEDAVVTRDLEEDKEVEPRPESKEPIPRVAIRREMAMMLQETTKNSGAGAPGSSQSEATDHVTEKHDDTITTTTTTHPTDTTNTTAAAAAAATNIRQMAEEEKNIWNSAAKDNGGTTRRHNSSRRASAHRRYRYLSAGRTGRAEESRSPTRRPRSHSATREGSGVGVKGGLLGEPSLEHPSTTIEGTTAVGVGALAGSMSWDVVTSGVERVAPPASKDESMKVRKRGRRIGRTMAKMFGRGKKASESNSEKRGKSHDR